MATAMSGFGCAGRSECVGEYAGGVCEGGRGEGATMRPVIFLRIASVLTLIHAALHTFGGVFGGDACRCATGRRDSDAGE